MTVWKRLKNYTLLLLTALVLLGLGNGSALALNLYIGDQGPFDPAIDTVISSVKVVNLNLASHSGTVSNFVSPENSGGLHGPRGVLFVGGNFLAVNQNVNLPFSGEVLSYNGVSGAPQNPLVPSSDPNAPFAPRGMILGKDGNSLYVANLFPEPQPPDFILQPGTVNVYGSTTGNFLSAITAPASFPAGQFHPRGVVFGPDGLLYVSSRTLVNNIDFGGWVLRFNPDGSFHDVFISDAGGGPGHLNSPEGLVFGPDGNLYVTSLASSDTPGAENAIRIYNSTGTSLDEIILGADSRALALLFGPDGNLFVPISTTGELRSYDIFNGDAKTDYSLSGETLIAPWYLTFRETDPHTLDFVPIPSSVFFMGSGLLGLMRWRRRKG